MNWLPPTDEHIIYEALSAIADGRFEMIDENNAKCTSTSKGKFYSVKYDAASNSIMSNDNMAYYRDELSYPMVAILLSKGEVKYNESILGNLTDIKWKDINQRNKNDYMKSVSEVLANLKRNGVNIDLIENEVAKIFEFLNTKVLSKLGNKISPPNAY
jgi:hypothetical protein